MADDKIKMSDLVSTDDSIEYLILQIDDLNKQFGKAVDSIKDGAKEIIKAMKDMNSVTSEGREKLDDAAIAASRLERAEKELKFAMSDAGKAVADLKAQTVSQNKMSAEQAERTRALAGSYDKLKLQVKDLTSRYKALSAAERTGEKGDRLLSQLMSKKQQVAELDKQMKLQIETISELERAEKKLAFLRSDEGKRLIEVKRAISDAFRREKADTDEVTLAQERLDKALRLSNITAQQLNQQANEANRIAKLTAQLNNSEVGSYNALAAQYELNKIKLNKMSKEERDAVSVGKALEEETRNIYAEMVRLQEATGNHKLSIGNYTKAWNGLGMATSQIIRELPAAAVGINTFFLGISNNIPILIDEINKVREANKQAIAQGKPTVSVMKQIVGAIFNWQTALVILITYLSMHGKEVIAWIQKLHKGADATMTLTERLEALQDELKTTNGSYGQNIVKLKELQRQWVSLTSKAERVQWIRDHKTEFDQLGFSINSVNEAENAFVINTEAIITAFKLRAKAAAAQKLATDKYEEALIKANEAETAKKIGKPAFSQKVMGALFLDPNWVPGSAAGANKTDRATYLHQKRIITLSKEAAAAEKDADAYFNLAAGLNAEADATLKNAGVKEKTKGPKKESKGRTPTDLTDIINKNEINLRKKYEMSITALQQDEFAKRRKAAMDTAMTEIDQLKEKYRKNETYIANIDGKYKALDDKQRAQITQQQQWILDTITNTQEKLKNELDQIEKERQVHSLQVMRETIDWELESIAKSLEEERKLRVQYIDIEYHQVSDANRKLREAGDKSARSENEIKEEYFKKQLVIIAEYDRKILALREADIEAQLELVKKGSQQELDLLLKQNEIARQIAIAENRKKPASEQQSEAQINKVYARRAQNITGTFTMTGFDEAQAKALAVFNINKHNQVEITKFTLQQEKERWEKQIALAKSGALDWSDAQIEAAEATVKGLERQIKEASSTINLIGEKGLGGALLTKLGFDDDQISALEDAANIVLDNIKAIFDAEVELAEMEVEKAKERVDAAQSAYEAEIEARNNGYANNVATAKKELQLEKKNQLEKEKLLEEAKKRQEAINTVIQASNLVTASALIWSQFGFPYAIPAIAAMWSSFALAKIKAAQVTRAESQEYGEGGLEFLEGGSHASGNDIDLATKNSKGKNMRAEGGEAMAIINKRNTRRYRKQLPGIINSLNKGTFEEKYLRAFESGETLQAQINQNPVLIDLSRLERDVTEIKKQNATKYYQMGDTALIVKGNVKRYIKQ